MIHSASPQSSRQWLSLDFEVLGRTDTLCENSDHYRPGLWSASWINKTGVVNDPLGQPTVQPAVKICWFYLKSIETDEKMTYICVNIVITTRLDYGLAPWINIICVEWKICVELSHSVIELFCNFKRCLLLL